jgi:NADPH2:quinone reductase|tara:strand:- start:1074 stop:2066 length:993 start_codon:yes stop_codon:yes gene_type:complete
LRAWQVNSFGEPADVLTFNDNAALFETDPDQVKIKVEAAGLGLPDVFSCQNSYPLTPPLPFVPSQEAAGTIVEVGENVDTNLIDQRVLGPTLFQEQRGGLAEFCLMSAQAIYEIPDGMSSEEAAGFYIPYQTAWVGLIHRGKITADDTVLILGASGSSGCAAVQLAKAVGARVIAVAGGPEKSRFCLEIGADEVIDHHSGDITGSARELTKGRGVDVIFDPVGGKPGRAAFKAIAFEGRFVVIGFASGEWARVNISETLLTNVSLVGAMPSGFSSEFYIDAHHDLMEHWNDGKLKVVGNQVFKFEDGLKAIQHIASGKVEGKVVVSVSGD